MMRPILLLAALLCAGNAESDGTVFIEVLGIAQDAGYPQAGCNAAHCRRAWDDASLRRHAVSLGLVDRRAGRGYLFDASPDLKDQLRALTVAGGSELAGVFLTHAHIGHYAGLVHFGHEAMGAESVPVYAMPRMTEFLTTSGPWDQLVRYGNIALRPLADGQAVSLGGAVRVTPLQVPHRDEYSETVGFRIDGPARSALYIPDIDKWQDWDEDLVAQIRSVDYALLDATFYKDGELPGRDMSAVRHPFVVETLAHLEPLSTDERSRVILIHFNHTNPLLIDGSAAQQAVEARGFRVARQGMRLPLN